MVSAAASTIRVRRLTAGLLDGALALVVALVPAAFPLGAGKGYAFGLGLLVGAAYIVFRDGIPYAEWGARSLGKRWLGVRPYRTDGAALDWRTSARRNVTLGGALAIPALVFLTTGFKGIPFDEILFALCGLVVLAEATLVVVDPVARRIGDRLANTRVIEARA